MLYKICDVIFDITSNDKYLRHISKEFEYFGQRSAECVISPTACEIESESIETVFREAMVILRKINDFILNNKCGTLVHSSAISANGRGVLFCASSGVGKSTHRAFWQQAFDDVQAINDDKPFVCIKDRPTVYGSPWKGKHRIGADISAVLDTVCFLERSTTNFVKKVESNYAMLYFLRQVPRYESLASMELLINICQNILSSVRVVSIGVTNSMDSAYYVRKRILGDI